MRRTLRVAGWLGSAAGAVLAAASTAEAGGFALREQSAYGQGLSFAGAAAGGSLSSMFWNPATLVEIGAIEIEAVATGVLPFSDVEYTSPAIGGATVDEGDIAPDALVPASYSAYRLNDRMVLGVGVNAGFGLSTEYDDLSPIRAAGVAGTSEVFSLNLNPAVAYQVTDWLALALGAQVQYASVELDAVGPLALEGDGVGVGLTAGVLLTPWQGTQIGLGYRSRIDHELEGELESPLGTLDLVAEDFDLPDTVTLGLRQSITDEIRLMAGVEWSNWSRFETVSVSAPPLTVPLGFNYDDAWFFSAGGEFDLNPQLTLRAGVGYELSPIDDANRSFRLPDSDRLWLSAGGSYKASDRWSIDAAYSFILPEETEILAAADGGPSGNGPFSGEGDAQIHIVSAAVKMKLGGAAHQANAEPR